jgi:uncharacterized SAM-binding protein YcdF (DUF218 family)
MRAGPPSLDQRILRFAQVLWDYHHVGHVLSPAEAIMVLCSHDTRVAERAAELFLEGMAPLLILSGGLGTITRQLMTMPEAEAFAAIAEKAGVPRACMLLEDKSTNTGENVAFTRRLLGERGLEIRRFILVQKPYMERRTYATFRKVWPEPEIAVTSPQVPMEEYLRGYSHPSMNAADVISIMVGDLQRIRVYPKLGFQIPQEIPDEVWQAYEQLVAAGFDSRLVPPEPAPPPKSRPRCGSAD